MKKFVLTQNTILFKTLNIENAFYIKQKYVNNTVANIKIANGK